MKRLMNQYVAAVAVVLGAGAAQADEIHVPAEQPTIQAAIDAAVDGDEIIVADGTYTGAGNYNLDFGGRAITLQSENGAAACIIDIQGNALTPRRGFRFHSGETATSVVDGFTVINGVMGTGGAMLIESGSDPTIRNCSFVDNTANPTVAQPLGGGAVAIYESQPTFDDCLFAGNTVLNANLSTGGGAIYIVSGSLTLAGCSFTGNSSTHVGGAIFCWTQSQMVASGCVFDGNTADRGGGGVVLEDAGTQATVTNCQFSGNTSGQNWGGGGLRVGGQAIADVIDCEFFDNVSSPGDGGAVHAFGEAHVSFANTVFSQNQADGGAGGALSLLFGAQAVAVNCLFQANQSGSNGGAIRVAEASLAQVDNCTFVQNSTSSGTGGAIRIGSISDGADISNSILWNNAPQQVSWGGPPLSVTYCDIQGGWAGEGNSDADPLFVDPDSGDFRLSAGSPCTDAGDNTGVPFGIATDLDGNPRFAHDPCALDTGNPDGTNPPVDMGAYEYQPPCPADLDCSGAVDFADLLAILAAWGTCTGCPEDLDGDDAVGFGDILVVLSGWGPCP